ncbi:MAG: protein translocase subunit SecD [Candidatus Berkelbacteria bacterium]|nr:protein translocase subunit SecD [Candidatus Berkelbacteria bacterium]
MKKFYTLIIILIIAFVCFWIDRPSVNPLDIHSLKIYKDLKIHQGLDLKGGVHLVYEGDFSKIDQKEIEKAHEGLINVIERRINALGVAEPTIQKGKIGDKRTIVIELPGISDTQEAIKLIGQTAQLKFLEQQGEEWKETGLTGANLKKADVEINNQTGEPEVAIEFDAEGAKLFKEITQRNLQKPVAIQLDQDIISAPTVQSVITEGKGVITGKFDMKEAKNLAISLTSGSLPVPVKLISQRNISATLGPESVKKSLMAGLLGVFLVMLFMIIYYKTPGVLATLALFVYSLIALAIFKLIPVTLTLAGIAGFILSIGMAVDANILIFERMREELRAGKTLGAAIEEGFRRAWSSIRDSNISSIITCLILIWLGSGLVRGFAVTLLIGILVSMFTAITVTRTFLRLFVNTSLEKLIKI